MNCALWRTGGRDGGVMWRSTSGGRSGSLHRPRPQTGGSCRPAVDDVDHGDDVDCVDQSNVPGARSASANGFSPFMRGEIRGRLQAEGENAEGEKTTRHIERTERLWLFVHCLLR